MSRFGDLCRRVRKAKRISPMSFLLYGFGFIGVFAVLHLAGLRERTAVFCGMLPAGSGSPTTALFLATLYAFFYFATVIAAPILILAAGVFHLLARRRPMPSSTGADQGDR